MGQILEKILYILRHAKAEGGGANQEDHERGLVERGVEAALAIGEYMQQHAMVPDKILCSTAVRAKETLRYVDQQQTSSTPVEYLEKLYMASANEMLGIVSKVSDDVRSLMLVGHNPGMHQLCLKLAAHGDEASLDTLHIKYPTCTLTAISFAGSWSDIAQVQGMLKCFVTPKMIGVGAN